MNAIRRTRALSEARNGDPHVAKKAGDLQRDFKRTTALLTPFSAAFCGVARRCARQERCGPMRDSRGSTRRHTASQEGSR